MWFSRVVGELSGYDVVVGEKGVDENEGEEEWKRIGVMEAEPPKLSLVLKWLLCSLIILSVFVTSRYIKNDYLGVTTSTLSASRVREL